MYSDPCFKIIGIDPGSDTLGLSVLEVDIVTLNLISIQAQTIVGRRMFDDKGWSAQLHGDRITRIKAHQENLTVLFRQIDPLCICAESPFINIRRPSAYGALVEVITMIRNAVMDYDPWKHLYLTDPPTVKKAVGAPGNADKTVVKAHVIKLLGSYYTPIDGVTIDQLDEHSIDAIAVGYSRLLGMRNINI